MVGRGRVGGMGWFATHARWDGGRHVWRREEKMRLGIKLAHAMKTEGDGILFTSSSLERNEAS